MSEIEQLGQETQTVGQRLIVIEQEIATAKECIKNLENLQKLQKNGAFKSLILEGYLKQHAERITGLLARTNEKEKTIGETKIVDMLKAVAYFKHHMRGIEAMGYNAKSTIEALEQEANLLRQYRDGVISDEEFYETINNHQVDNYTVE